VRRSYSVKNVGCKCESEVSRRLEKWRLNTL